MSLSPLHQSPIAIVLSYICQWLRAKPYAARRGRRRIGRFYVTRSTGIICVIYTYLSIDRIYTYVHLTLGVAISSPVLPRIPSAIYYYCYCYYYIVVLLLFLIKYTVVRVQHNYLMIFYNTAGTYKSPLAVSRYTLWRVCRTRIILALINLKKSIYIYYIIYSRSGGGSGSFVRTNYICERSQSSIVRIYTRWRRWMVRGEKNTTFLFFFFYLSFYFLLFHQYPPDSRLVMNRTWELLPRTGVISIVIIIIISAYTCFTKLQDDVCNAITYLL